MACFPFNNSNRMNQVFLSPLYVISFVFSSQLARASAPILLMHYINLNLICWCYVRKILNCYGNLACITEWETVTLVGKKRRHLHKKILEVHELTSAKAQLYCKRSKNKWSAYNRCFLQTNLSTTTTTVACVG